MADTEDFRDLLDDLDLTVTEAATKANSSPQTLYYYLQGSHSPNRGTVRKMSYGWGITRERIREAIAESVRRAKAAVT